MCRAKSEAAMASLISEAKKLFGGNPPPPPWNIEGQEATWKSAWQVVSIELGASGSRGREYWELYRYAQGLISAAKALRGQGEELYVSE